MHFYLCEVKTLVVIVMHGNSIIEKIEYVNRFL